MIVLIFPNSYVRKLGHVNFRINLKYLKHSVSPFYGFAWTRNRGKLPL